MTTFEQHPSRKVEVKRESNGFMDENWVVYLNGEPVESFNGLADNMAYTRAMQFAASLQ